MANDERAGDVLVQRMKVATDAAKGVIRAGRHHAGQAFAIRRIDLGRILLPTGRIGVSDAFSAEKYPPLNRLVPPGEYAVELVVAEIPKDLEFGNDRAAYVVVTFAKDDVTVWEPVTAVSPDRPNFEDKRPNVFVQEAATAVFSPEAAAVHYAHLRQQFDTQVKALREQAKRFGTNDWLNYKPGKGPENVITVEGGFGDGYYSCYVGLSAAGRVARLVLDFEIADAAG